MTENPDARGGVAAVPPATDSPGIAGFAAWLGAGAAVLVLGGVSLLVHARVSAAAERLENPEAEKPKVAIAQHAEVAYCTPRFKEVLKRVLHSCGLAEGETRRGCKPADVKMFASISDADFNELFTPLKQRGGVLMFDTGAHELDERAQKLLEDRFYDRKGARYFFVVARASKTGTPAKNRALSHRRANSVMFHLREVSKDPELDGKVGLLWLGNEFAQLSGEYCDWVTSRPNEQCGDEPINRSAFVSWVDCRL
jgi:outer membrane protein OmpA-like peptidoglycan-associated protein